MKDKFSYFLIAVLVGILIWLSLVFGLFFGLENFFEDILFSPKPLDARLVIIAVDEESLSRLGQWPWPREIFAKALLKFNENPPLALALDIMFSEPSRLGKKDDQAFLEALDKISYPVILPVEAYPLLFPKGKPAEAINLLKPLPDFYKGKKQIFLGAVNLAKDADGIVRRFPVFVSERESGIKYQALAYEAVEQSGLRIPKKNLEYSERIVYSAIPGSVRKIPFWRILEGEAAGELKDKIVFLGPTASDFQDSKPTPMSRGLEMPGVEIHAQIANMLLAGYRLYPLSEEAMFFWLMLAAFIPALFFAFSKRHWFPIFAGLVFGGANLFVVIILFQKGIIANFVHLNLSWIISTASLFGCRFFIGEEEKRQIKSVFSKYVSKEVLQEILKDPGRVALGGEEKEITVLFCDIRGFTSLSEKIPPQKLVGFLNRYFSEMSEAILKNGGVLDKYIGDAVMAFWGAPIEDERQADKALSASLAMLKALNELNAEFRRESSPEIDIGIGIYTGPAVVGNIGSEIRFDYTAIGDTVNAASRLEGLTKEYKAKIIIGETTKDKLKENYPLKFLGQALVKGKEKPISIYTYLGN